MAKDSNQLTLSLFDSTSLSGGLTLDSGGFRPSTDVPEEDEAPAVLAPPAIPAQDFVLRGDRQLAHGWKARAADNLAAIRLALEIEAEKRNATSEEQDVLSRFVGFGACDLADIMFRRAGESFAEGWEDLGEELERLVPREELASLARATQYAHYTPEFIIRAIWRAVQRMGFAGGAILEPGCGTGLFFSLMPEALAGKSSLTGVEMDATTARIASQLFPNAWIRREDFTKARLSESFELVIGNPPFSDRRARLEGAERLDLSLHDYFIARSVERLKPGGLAAFVTSRWTMDKVDDKARAHIAVIADLVGAIRLPEGAMNAAAGTDVVIDILFLQRRAADQEPAGALWQDLAEAIPAEDGEEALSINRYFIDHPEMVMGLHARTSSAYGPTYTCLRKDRAALDDEIDAAVSRLPRGIHQPSERVAATAPSRPALRVGTAAEGATIKEGSFVIVDDALMQIIDGAPCKIEVRGGKGGEGIPAKHARIIRTLIPIRDAIREVLRAQEANEPWGPAQTRLRIAYNSFLRNFGAINLTTISETTDPKTGEARETQRRPNLQPFLDDPDVWLVASIEDYDVETGVAKKGPIFSERVLHPPATPTIESAADALAVTLHELGHVDIDRIAELLGRSRDEALAELGDRVFLDPQTTIEGFESWQTADAYLSGPVRTKLAAAIIAAERDARYRRNVEALGPVQPEDLKPSDISARLGAPWIPTADVTAFVAEVIGVEASIRHTIEIASWTVELSAFSGRAEATSEWGTARRNAGLLLGDALNSSIPQIYDVWKEDGRERRELNAAETEAAKEKLAKIKTAFERWVWTNVERAERLTRIYNDQFNNLVPRHFDGAHLQLPGASSVIKFYDHQKRAIWRIVSAGKTYIAHSVGAGKTFTIAAAIMEQKRLGLVAKAMLVVPGHCLAQASREFLLLYPNARILVADETNFSKDKRQRFLARAATAQWDCIIITHSAFKFVPAPAAFEQALIQTHLASYSELLEKIDGDDRISRKRIERMKEGLEAKLEALQSRKDDLLTIGEMGVDQLIVDEAQEFRKLSFATNMTSLKGVDPDGSQRAWDLFVKSRFVDEKNPGRALLLASGTPITNTLGEMFTLQRFMQPETLEERGIHEFDAWAATFGETRTELELQPSGLYKPVTRFSEFVNVADLMAMYRSVADVVLKSDLRHYLRLPSVKGGKRQIVTAEPTAAFKAYQKILAERIAVIEKRKTKPEKGDDILLSVITDGRHAAIDLRFVLPGHANEDGNKLNALIDNVFAIWRETADRRYTRADGVPYLLPGAAQMIFSDLGTLNVEATRGFSAYRWIKSRLVALGVLAEQIAFMQDYKKSSAKQRLFQDINAGKTRILIGSSDTMGTGVNAQRRLVALHHLDVPWLPSHIEQREGRIERQGNENEEIELYAYATKGSVDATGWQLLERKARFIEMAMSGDRSIRRLEDAGSQVNQFAMAKAIASGDPRLMQKAGLEAEIARLERLRDAHFDDQYAVRRTISTTEASLRHAEKRIAEIEQDIARRTPTRGDAFRMEVNGERFVERKDAGAALLRGIRAREFEGKGGEWRIANIGGFDLSVTARSVARQKLAQVELTMQPAGRHMEIEYSHDLTPLGIVSRLEYCLSRFEVELAEQKRAMHDAAERLPAYRRRLDKAFAYENELDMKRDELAALDASLAANDDGKSEAPSAA
ncbi:DEAD/DEAH box helicase family protein [Methylosinus sp. Sm6]|uniref:DEAD/DEAH box helicase family protein n=1 Tax=Methylosinus sp. Sm6 TaxID=2866948 RepID=UPI001C99DF1E|nr:DEAD/DEAH box helicase family protein [Methylosinus sp. Sm6]MBY6240483.1 DEAD/DEAH box helicase family protein [Methylosinus sp. Sm6]